MYTVTCSQCGQPIDILMGNYQVILILVEQRPTNVYLHEGQCETDWEAEQLRRRSGTRDDENSPQLRLFDRGGTIMEYRKVLFPPGQVVATPGALELGIDLVPYFWRHMTGDWGDLDEDDKRENQFALERHLRILSAYNTPAGKLWIITEADRSATTFLLPDEY